LISQYIARYKHSEEYKRQMKNINDFKETLKEKDSEEK
jgi:hypothetical protein